MALIISPGPLPIDKTRINVENTLTSFILGTKIRNLDVGNFGGTVNFIYSATDEPATEARSRGLLYFQRGTGRLLQWRNALQPSGFSTSSMPPAGLWVSVCDTKDIAAQKGGDNGAVNPIGSIMQTWMSYDPFFKKAEQSWLGSQFLSMCSTQNSLPLYRNLCDPLLIYVTEAIGGSVPKVNVFAAMKDWGFCEANVRGNGPIAYISGAESDLSEYGMDVLLCTSTSLASTHVAEVGYLCQSDAATGLRQATTIFQVPA